MSKKSITDIVQSKSKRQLVCTTAYTFPVARYVSDAEYDIILIGDSLGMEIQGYPNTLYVTLEDIIYHCRAVVRGNVKCFVVADMPFLSADISIPEAVRNAGMLIQKGGADAVKIEGDRHMADTIAAIVKAGIPVMGHIGLNPQKILEIGRFSVQGRTEKSEKDILETANALVDAGVFSIVLECIPSHLSKVITGSIPVPTIGIGAGSYCDGQILVSNDIFGMRQDFKPKFVKQYANISEIMKEALLKYKSEVVSGQFPDEEHSYK